MQVEYEVIIGDADVEPETDDRKPTPEVRCVIWHGTARSDDDARNQAWIAWDDRYGRGRQPAKAIVNVRRLAA